MLGNRRAQKIETEDVIAQIGVKVGGNSLGDLKRRELDSILSKGALGERRNHNTARLFALEHSLDFAVTLHAIGEAVPDNTFPRFAYRMNKMSNAGWMNDQTSRKAGQCFTV